MKIINMIDVSARKMDDVVKSMNEVMAIQNEKIKKEWLDLNRHFENVLEQIKPRLERNNITVTKDFEREPMVFANREYIDDILKNLISNAIYYRSPQRQCSISVSSQRFSNYRFIQVKDNGVELNVKKDKIFRIYQPPGNHSEKFWVGLLRGKGSGGKYGRQTWDQKQRRKRDYAHNTSSAQVKKCNHTLGI